MRVGREFIKRDIFWIDFDIKDNQLCDDICKHGKLSTGCDLFDGVRKRNDDGKFIRLVRCYSEFGCCPHCSARRLKKMRKLMNLKLRVDCVGDEVQFIVDGECVLAAHNETLLECQCQPWKQVENMTVEQMRNYLGWH